jgi:hypothetical protein
MALKQYAVVLALGVLVGMVLGGTVMAMDVAPIETVDDVIGSDDELAGIGDGPDVGTSEPTDTGGDSTPTDSGTDTGGATTDDGTATATPGSDGGTDTPDSTATPADTATATPGSGSTATGTATAANSPFSFVVTNVESCGDTCRDITAELTNDQSSAAENVTTFTEMYAGNSTDADDKVWEGRDQFGTLAAGETVETTQRVEFSLNDGIKIRNNGGWVTIVTTIRSNGETQTVTERRKVN